MIDVESRTGTSGAPLIASGLGLVALDKRHLLARLRQVDGEEPAALAGPDHNNVIAVVCHGEIVTL